MTADFSQFTHELVERYFRTSLFYGMYPSMFTNLTHTVMYFDDPNLYERDRDLFIFYIPLIRTLGEAGWEPITYAVSSELNVYVERYGTGEFLYITTRNETEEAITYELSIDAEPLGLPLETNIIFENLLSGDTFTATPDGANLTFTDTLEPDEVRMFHPSY